jgi:hypothetical protein
VYLAEDPERRLAVVQDLLAAHSTSCNERAEYRTRFPAELEQ